MIHVKLSYFIDKNNYLKKTTLLSPKEERR